ncbi:hypothetical protein QTH97_35535 [Variovorax sp. J22R24]|uniref:hypothetical protein n=1 Tax=Variovorax gracilis TaxID=3053502 RepID=UPI002574F42E|nr:hypothetical protein [Variovorax sp. J22R24]MDM0110248.1 hypothetical protein [Variovorax sp. J22R24]
MSRNPALHEFEYDGWQVVVELRGAAPDGVTSGHADLMWRTQHRCRIALAGPFRDDASALEALEVKARAFIDAWDGHSASDATDLDA